jgi:hypothetical protein
VQALSPVAASIYRTMTICVSGASYDSLYAGLLGLLGIYIYMLRTAPRWLAARGWLARTIAWRQQAPERLGVSSRASGTFPPKRGKGA